MNNIAVVITISVLFVLFIARLYTKKKNKLLDDTLKAICTISIIILAVINLKISVLSHYDILIFIGLLFALAGDIAICFSLKCGMIFFMIMHGFYCAAFISLGFTPYCLIVFALLFAIAVALFKKSGASLQPMLIAYIAALLLMATLSVTYKSPLKYPFCILPIAATLFVISDYTLYQTFDKPNNVFLSPLSNFTYLSAQLLFAISIIMM